jgi:hypothetical protein
VSQHIEFPRLTQEARAAHDAALTAIQSTTATISHNDFRRALRAFLCEAMNQACEAYVFNAQIARLEAIADNLHNPPLPPPTLAQARTADLETQEGIETVRAFLAALGEGGQP